MQHSHNQSRPHPNPTTAGTTSEKTHDIKTAIANANKDVVVTAEGIGNILRAFMAEDNKRQN
ncbi:hypothetical protein [Dermatophilus congolensis]|uniref:hypothetical protein n=1 Tax=Dermatophilus congolensis TaxID=1863 RepID=UPI001AAFA4DB|nr:hypothetical protein [Dermatophilus congolensis]MBO3143952.1 hypothetical protein [Dermatophilus congolensis]MBO3152942.1 hypothetical protein [Dermatophilus congolensis]MBO3160046.1 hypothetical protein [Dermatophilus congolensis]MBO3164230.1 hypothetical protein [Dermatophilus congolensis]MBO3177774.1 hypothetical protein [Dermatophilus congolensis]